jgi:hypothetical protein
MAWRVGWTLSNCVLYHNYSFLESQSEDDHQFSTTTTRYESWSDEKLSIIYRGQHLHDRYTTQTGFQYNTHINTSGPDRPFLGYVWEDADAVDKHATRLLVDVAGFVIGIQTAVSTPVLFSMHTTTAWSQVSYISDLTQLPSIGP